jgi:AcrR family transcriptional regulator
MSGTVITYDLSVGRWAPGARGRLQAAAFELYAANGFEQTTVAEIAAHAGVTERTFYRYFADKREAFFDGSQELQRVLVEAIEACPPEVGPLDAVATALHHVAREFFADRLAMARRRQALIDATPELHEREQTKMTGLVTALTAALRARDVDEPTAGLVAQTGIAVFRVAFARWIAKKNKTSLAELIASALDELRAITAPR